MGQTQRISRNNTTIKRELDSIVIRLHSTDIVKITLDSITLNTGGWHTSTTRNRMNQVAHEMSLGYSVYQKDFEWYVRWEGKDYPFKDGIVLRHGRKPE